MNVFSRIRKRNSLAAIMIYWYYMYISIVIFIWMLVCVIFQPPRIGGVKVYTKNVRRDEIYMDLDIM